MGSIPSIPANKEYILDSRISFSDRSDVINREDKEYRCTPPYFKMVYVAEWFRRKFVALVYAGSIPVVHPKPKIILLHNFKVNKNY